MKDIAIVLFVAQPALMLIAGSLGLMEGWPSWGSLGIKELGNENKLELWLCSLNVIFYPGLDLPFNTSECLR